MKKINLLEWHLKIYDVNAILRDDLLIRFNLLRLDIFMKKNYTAEK